MGFSSLSGKPILVNHQMNSLVEIITGHTVIEANSVWNELIDAQEYNKGCIKLDKPWLKTDDSYDNENSLIFLLPDGKVWHFRRQILANESISTVQIEASEITQLYHMSEELYANNIRLVSLRKRQEALLSNIVQINRERELLSTKMRIHDDLGRCLVATKKALDSKDIAENEYKELLDGWEEAIRDMPNVPLQGVSVSPEAELRKVADLVGCRIEFIGEQPTERRTLLLLYSAIREALTNAVRHAGADQLTVNISRNYKGSHIVISSNGSSSVSQIRETGGLASLRKSLEQEGAELGYICSGGTVAVVVDIPDKNIGNMEA